MFLINAYLYGKVAPVNIIAQKEVACICWTAPDFEKLHHIVELAVNVPAN